KRVWGLVWAVLLWLVINVLLLGTVGFLNTVAPMASLFFAPVAIILSIVALIVLAFMALGRKSEGSQSAREDRKEKKPASRGRILVKSIFWGVAALAAIVAAGVSAASVSWLLVLLVALASPLLLLVAGFLMVYFWWAPNNLFFTFVAEGTSKIVVRGDALEEELVQWDGHTVARKEQRKDPADSASELVVDVWDIIPDTTVRRRFFGGLRFYGVWPLCDIYLYDFSWTNMTHDGEIQEHPRQRLDYVLLKDDVYFAKVLAAEDKKLLPLDIGMVLRIRVVNPKKAAISRVENWLETTINLIEPCVRFVLSTDTYENWVRLKKDLGEEVFRKLGAEGLVKQLRDLYGVELVSLGVKSYDPTSAESLGELRRATLQKYLAERNREKVLVDADAEKRRLVTVGVGESKRLELVGQGAARGIQAVLTLGDAAVDLRKLEVMSAPGNTMYVLGGPGPMPQVILQPPPPKTSGPGGGGGSSGGGTTGGAPGGSPAAAGGGGTHGGVPRRP
ncbi:MAG: hypothetical protein PHQ43_14510, partial [Dehalococcoidales bacterium]|nr:hypothetical protein [Dehalococcoidales bacterium]